MPSAFEYRIHPAVGIARMGNSSTTYFLANEKPRQPIAPVQATIPGQPDKRAVGIRDADGNLCKQGARFRVFCYEYDLVPVVGVGPPAIGALQRVWECTPADYDITWTVQVANHKAQAKGTPLLSAKRKNDPDPVTLPNAPASGLRTFTGKPSGRLSLGSCFVDGAGRLVVLGSDGKAKRFEAGATAQTPEELFWAGFEDDAADGPVTAQVTPKPGSVMPDVGGPRQAAVGAWVINAVPAYGADLRATVTLHDLATNHAYETAKKGRGRTPEDLTKLVTWTQAIRPLILAQYSVFWAMAHHGSYKPYVIPSHMASNALFKLYMRPARQTDKIKPESIWEEFKAGPPDGMPEPAPSYGALTLPPGTQSMPHLLYVTITELQQQAVDKWAAGTLPKGSDKAETSPLPLYQPYQLDLAHLETCSGGSFFPGIEVDRRAHWYKTWEGRHGVCPEHYDVRVTKEVDDSGTEVGPARAGYLTTHLACPWQADFVACSGLYWPHSRPIRVRPEAGGAGFIDFISDAGGSLPSHTSVDGGANGAVRGGLAENFWKLGVLRYESGSKEIRESQRAGGFGARAYP